MSPYSFILTITMCTFAYNTMWAPTYPTDFMSPTAAALTYLNTYNIHPSSLAWKQDLHLNSIKKSNTDYQLVFWELTKHAAHKKIVSTPYPFHVYAASLALIQQQNAAIVYHTLQRLFWLGADPDYADKEGITVAQVCKSIGEPAAIISSIIELQRDTLKDTERTMALLTQTRRHICLQQSHG